MEKKSLKILIVDDNRANLRILGATFEDEGFSIFSASTVEKAQDILQVHVNEIDLVLSDIQMPGLSGFDLVTWMKAERSSIKDIPILLITSQMPDSEHRILGLSLGAVDYLPRSLDPQELVLRAAHAIESFRQIRSLRQTLETTESLTATGRLFAASNHEIKNVTQIICMATGILERELGPDKVSVSDTCRQALKFLQQSSSLLSDLTKMIGGLVGNATAPSGPVELDNLVDQTLCLFKALLKGGITLLYRPYGSAWALGNPTFIKQILLNLLLNAKDAILEAKPDDPGIISIVIGETAGSFTLQVTDNGIGFPRQETRTEFQAFASTKQLRGGTGLGLWLSAHLASKMDGQLSLRSDGLGQGASAIITLKKAKA